MDPSNFVWTKFGLFWAVFGVLTVISHRNNFILPNILYMVRKLVMRGLIYCLENSILKISPCSDLR